MGGGTYSTKDWDSFSKSRAYHKKSTTVDHIYSSKKLHPDLDPKKFRIRESLDSPSNPNSTPVIIGLDVTGSMDSVLDSVARKGLKTVCEGIYDRKPITDPHICVLGIGDLEWDLAPFQATQFEADIRIFEHLEKLYLERGGGGNYSESYSLAWYFAAMRTKTDSFKKRGQKGFIFTIGDEQLNPGITRGQLNKHLGEKQADDWSSQRLFEEIRDSWNVYHIILKEGSHCRMGGYSEVLSSWQKVIDPQRVISLDDHKLIGETIVSVLELHAGKSIDDVAKSWDGSTGVVVADALGMSMPTPGRHTLKPVDKYL